MLNQLNLSVDTNCKSNAAIDSKPLFYLHFICSGRKFRVPFFQPVSTSPLRTRCAGSSTFRRALRNSWQDATASKHCATDRFTWNVADDKTEPAQPPLSAAAAAAGAGDITHGKLFPATELQRDYRTAEFSVEDI